MRREVAASMVENDFFRDLDFLPNLVSSLEPIWIGISQLADPPAYYWVLAQPLRILRHFDAAALLLLLRFFSLTFYLATIAIGYGIVREITSAGNPLRWLVPLSMALTPAFTDLMTAVNNDVGATFVFSLYLWLGIRIIRQGLSLSRFLAILGTTTLCWFTKNTVWVAIPLALLLLLVLVTQKWKLPGWLPGGLIMTGVLAMLLGLFTYGDAALWYRRDPLVSRTDLGPRSRADTGVVGTHAFRIRLEQGESPPLFFQPLSTNQMEKIAGQEVTLGAWVWADTPVMVRSPTLWIDRTTRFETIEIGPTPTFFSFREIVPKDARQVQLVLNPARPGPMDPVEVYIDGLILVDGSWPLDEPPRFDDPRGRTGVWGGRSFQNIARNSSFEAAWFSIPAGVDRWFRNHTPINLSQVVATAQDLETLGWVYRLTATNLFQSFWARFGWNHIRLTSPWYYALAGFTGLALTGAFVGLLQSWTRLERDLKLSLLWLGTAMILVWAGALIRLVFPLWGNQVILPSARYAFPAIIPSVLLLVAGWDHLFKTLHLRGIDLVWLLFVFLTLDTISLITIHNFYG